jgi:hypothetical protein
MKLLQTMACGLALTLTSAGAVNAQQPSGVPDVLSTLASTPSTHTAFTFDHDMLQTANGYLNGGASGSGGPAGPVGELDSITVENYRYHEPAFYIPENMHTLVQLYNAAGWKHLVDQNPGPKESAAPKRTLTDLWLHFKGADIDDMMVLVRGEKQMSVIEVSGVLSPLNLVHLSGHLGIPKVDPGAVMVPAPPGK